MQISVGKRYDRPAPAFCANVLKKFGQNRFGKNIFRVVWSDGQFMWGGGLWRDHLDDSASRDMLMPDGTQLETNPVIGQKAEYRSIAKYADHPGRWILEKWLPTLYSRDEWYRRFMDKDSGLCLLGPYPDKGNWHFCYELSLRGQYRELSAGLIEAYTREIEASKQYTEAEIRRAEQQKREREERDWNNRFDAVWADSMPVGGVGSIFSGPGQKSKERVKPEDLDIAPYTQRTFRQV
jgi:hypothetical protein